MVFNTNPVIFNFNVKFLFCFGKKNSRISCLFPKELPLTLPCKDREVSKVLFAEGSSSFHICFVIVDEILCVIVYKPAVFRGVVYCKGNKTVIRCPTDTVARIDGKQS